MNDELAAPVRGIANAIHRGIVKTQRICKSVQRTPTPNVLDTLQPVQSLEASLARSESRIKDAYAESTAVLGRKFAESFESDHVTTNKLQSLTINLVDQLNSLDDYMDDPEGFDIGSLPYIQIQSERCCDQALACLSSLRQQLLRSGLQQFDIPKDDRAQLPSLRRIAAPVQRPVSEVSPMTEFPSSPLGIQMMAVPSPSQTKSQRIPNPSQHETSVAKATSWDIFADELQEMPVSSAASGSNDVSQRNSDVPEPLKVLEVKIKNNPEGDEPQLIMRDEVIKQMTAIEEFLEKRKLSRELFQEELKRSSFISMSSTSSRRSFTASLPYLPTPTLSESPIQSRPNSNLLKTIMENADPNGRPVPPKDDRRRIAMERQNSGTSSGISPVRSREVSELLAYENPVSPISPPLSQGHQSAGSGWGTLALAGTLKVPGFGEGVVDGIEVVNTPVISDPGLMLAKEDEGQNMLTPEQSVQSMDYTIRHDCSFYKYGGFCDGAKSTLRGVGGTMREIKRPGGMYTDLLSMRCVSCSFEAGYNNFKKDQRLEKTGILSAPKIDDIKYRSRFLIKSHLKTKLADSPIYGCLFCIEENKTLEEQDATVFFTPDHLFRHLQRHPRPLREIEGITVVYGPQPDNIVDIDLHFLNMVAKVSPFADIAAKLSSDASGFALVNHREGNKGFKAVDPEARPTLRFAIGARIVGITFPPRYSGTWCSGYHDSEKALFPSSVIQLEPPQKEDVSMHPKSTLASVAKWEFQPRDSNSGWLAFKKKERITHISYPYQDFWCWSGMNSKGKWGLFPREFVDGLVDTGDGPDADFRPGTARPGTARPQTAISTAAPTISEPMPPKSKLFKFGGSGGTGANQSVSPEKEREQPQYPQQLDPEPASSPTGFSFGTKRKTSNTFISAFRRNGTVKSHASADSSESAYSSSNPRRRDSRGSFETERVPMKLDINAI